MIVGIGVAERPVAAIGGIVRLADGAVVHELRERLRAKSPDALVYEREGWVRRFPACKTRRTTLPRTGSMVQGDHVG